MLPLSDHPIEESLKKRRDELSMQWNDDQIFDCAPKTAQLVLLYVDLENRLQNKVPSPGRSFFFRDQSDSDLLNLYIVDDQGLVKHTIKITSEGTLSYFDTIFNTPEDLLRAITLKRFVVHYRVIIPANSPLASVLRAQFDPNCVLYCPPEYPPLLVHIALANNDLATAAAIIEHPFIHASDNKSPGNSRLRHLLGTALSNAVTEDRNIFLKYLIQKYDLTNCEEYLFKPAIAQAIECKNQAALEYLFEKTNSKDLEKAFEAAFRAVVNAGEKAQFSWLLENIPPGITVKEFSKASFLKALLVRLGPDCFKMFVDKVAVDVPKEDLLNELLLVPIDPMNYLPCYEALFAGPQTDPTHNLTGASAPESLEAFPLEVKAKLLLQFINYGEGSDILWKDFLTQFFPMTEQTAILSSALLSGLKDPRNAARLIDAGAIPTAEHFDKLLRAYSSGSQRLEMFTLFLDAVPDLLQGKNSLASAAAFGQEAVKRVFDRFPELATQPDFMLALTAGIWKGAEAATDQVLYEVMSMQSKKDVSPDPEFPLNQESAHFALDESLLAIPLAHEISLNYLLDVLLRRKQVDKIALALKQRPECIFGFWHGCIFSGFEFFENPDWENLADETLSLVDEETIYTLIEQAIYYSHLQLAEVWLKLYLAKQFNQKAAFKWFEAALKVSNIEAVPLFVKYRLHLQLNDRNESFLELAVSYNAISFVSALLEHDPNRVAQSRDLSLSYAHAVQNQYLTICRLLEGAGCFEEIAKEYMALSVEEVEERLYKAVLNSSCKDVKLLCSRLLTVAKSDSRAEQISSLCKKIEEFIQNCGPLIVRFPSPQAQKEMHICYGRAYASYSLQQRTWGEVCGKYYDGLVEEYQQSAHSLFELLLKFTKLQAGLKAYNFWRMGSIHSLMTYFQGRYFSFWRITQKMFKRLVQNPAKYAGELCLTPDGYQVLYQLDETKNIPLSSLHICSPFAQGIFKGWMGHSEPAVTKELLPHLEVLFNEIQNYSIPSDEKGFPKELKRKIALLFWLGCHLVFTARGSSQYMLLLHRLLFDLHGFQTPSWDLNYVQPDCVAIMLPFSIFYEEYYDELFDV